MDLIALLLVVMMLVFALVVIYLIVVWNDFSRRYSAITAAWANVRAIRARRHSVDRTVAQSVTGSLS